VPPGGQRVSFLKSRRLAIFLALAVLLLGLVITYVSFSRRYAAAGAEAGTAFLQQIGAQGAEAAYDSTAQGFRAQQTKQSFVDLTKQLALDEVDEVSWSSRSFSGFSAALKGTASLHTGAKLPVEMTLVRENGAWRVAGMSVYRDTAQEGDFAEAVEALSRQDYPHALELLQPLAEQGFAPAQFNLGVLYAAGYGTPADQAKAAAWFEKAAAQKYAEAENALGTFYREGTGVAADPARAAELFRKAADQNLPKAQYNLGVLLERGEGIAQDKAQAASLYLAAADQGFAEAQYSIGLCYADGVGVAADPVQAYKWFTLAARGNEPNAAGDLQKVVAKLTPDQRTAADALVTEWHVK
jgi:TPR repeat protein